LRSLTYIIPGMLWTRNLLRDITYVLMIV
jgi:hypothetical protein